MYLLILIIISIIFILSIYDYSVTISGLGTIAKNEQYFPSWAFLLNETSNKKGKNKKKQKV